ncbi:hypothetical protein ACFL21_05210 [Patescibacteria group bacterium]
MNIMTDRTFKLQAELKKEQEGWGEIHSFHMGSLEKNVRVAAELRIDLIKEGTKFAIVSSDITGEFAILF